MNASPPALPRSLGRYVVSGRLGAGAMGTVYQARDELLGREVAVKVLRIPGVAAGAAGQLFRQRFANEARAISALGHPNIVQVFDMGFEGEIPFLVLELVTGPSLAKRRGEQRLDADEARLLAIDIARALSAAHAAGVLHRDVKPENILRANNGGWKLADFGVARIPDSSVTLTGQFVGTSAYAAPESLVGGVFSPASDVYALGVTLYEALAGQRPFGDRPMAAVAQDPPPLERARAELPIALCRLIMRMISRDPAGRPSSGEVVDALTAAVTTPTPPLAPPTPARAPRDRAPRPAWLGRRGLIVAGVLAAAVMTAALWPRGRADVAATAPPRDVFAPVRARVAAGDLAAARDELKQIVARDPGNEAAREWLSRIEDALPDDEEQQP